MSDAAFISLGSGWVGIIARPSCYDDTTTGPGCDDYSEASVFEVVGKAPNSWQQVGTSVDKIGKVSGWTRGRVTATCVDLYGDYNEEGESKYLDCQWVADLYSVPGDSGGPMGYVLTVNQWELWGTLKGGPYGDYTVTYYSPISGIEGDLGALYVLSDGSYRDSLEPH